MTSLIKNMKRYQSKSLELFARQLLIKFVALESGSILSKLETTLSIKKFT